jgi:hypothetical protein
MNTDLKFLTTEEIAQKAPVLLYDNPTRDLSDRYTFASTKTVIDDMTTLGWFPTEVHQRKAKQSFSKYSPHMVKFSNPDLRISDGDGDVSFPQIILQNSYDGRSSLKFTAGIFRFVCSNGLIIATAKFGELSIKHKGYSFDEMRKLVSDRTESIPEQIQVMNDMKSKMLTQAEREALAMQAILIRSNVPAENLDEFKGKIDKLTLKDILTPLRKEDHGNDLWSTYQVTQEKLMKGNFYVQLGMDAKIRKVKAIKSFERDVDYNKQLFESARQLMAA